MAQHLNGLQHRQTGMQQCRELLIEEQEVIKFDPDGAIFA